MVWVVPCGLMVSIVFIFLFLVRLRRCASDLRTHYQICLGYQELFFDSCVIKKSFMLDA